MSRPKRKTIGNYEILRELGQGGMGVVYLALQPALEREVVIKSLRRGFADDPEFDERFRREAQAAAGIHHPNTVAVHDCFGWRGERFIVQEYVAGENLAHVLRDVRRFESRIAAVVALELARGLEEVHARNVVHRDLKPANVLLGRSGAVKIADFGIAFEAGRSALTRTGVAIGTPAYMAPEQHRGERADSRSDVFAFGVVLYEMLTGVRPFPDAADESDPTLVEQIEAGRYAPVRKLTPGTQRWLAALVERCLRAKPKHRPENATALREALERGVGRATPAECRSATATWLRDRGVFAPDPDETGITPQAPKRLRLTGSLPLAFAATALVVASVGLVHSGRTPTEALDEVRATLAKAGTRSEGEEAAAGPTAEVAKLLLLAPSGTEIHVDGEPTDGGDPGGVSLPPGRHRIAFRHPDLGRVDRIVDLAAGSRHTVEAVFVSRPPSN